MSGEIFSIWGNNVPHVRQRCSTTYVFHAKSCSVSLTDGFFLVLEIAPNSTCAVFWASLLDGFNFTRNKNVYKNKIFS